MKVLLLLFIIIYLSFVSNTPVKTLKSNVNLLEVLNRSKRSTDDSSEGTKLVKILVFALIFLFLIGLVLVVWLLLEHRRVARARESYQENLLDDVGTQVLRNEVEYDEFKDRYEIDIRNLKKLEGREKDAYLGKGFFGIAIKRQLKHVNDKHPPLLVAVKQALDDQNGQQNRDMLLKEILIMCKVNALNKHPNILALVGAFTTNNEMLIITELAHCDLRKYIKPKDKPKIYSFQNLIIRDESEKKTGYSMESFEISDSLALLSTYDLISFAYQIANGMVYLASIPCVHRDLALRNILIMSNKAIRIGDFGLARKHKEDGDYYIKETENATPRFTAPESLEKDSRYFNKYSEKSDVWPFALCLYELFTLGGRPLDDADGDLNECLLNEKWLSEPENCLSETYEFMKFCWEKVPGRRPTFALCRLFFEMELKKFPDPAFDQITKKLKLESETQKSLEGWVRKDYKEEQKETQDGIELTPLLNRALPVNTNNEN